MSYPYQIKSIEQYRKAYGESIENPSLFWDTIARHFVWHKEWEEVLNWDFNKPKVEWFKGAKLNITENCLDRWAVSQPDTPAIIWEPNDPTEAGVTLTYKELHFKVCEFAQVLKNNGAKKEIVFAFTCRWFLN